MRANIHRKQGYAIVFDVIFQHTPPFLSLLYTTNQYFYQLSPFFQYNLHIKKKA